LQASVLKRNARHRRVPEPREPVGDDLDAVASKHRIDTARECAVAMADEKTAFDVTISSNQIARESVRESHDLTK
jgi:hypothetical protein